jgi:bifunctional N-acetylglucosamine-1-phosphate-uridyltransferase/glucosamine-1-phosphate-acetyltransferase GlmU-like protein
MPLQLIVLAAGSGVRFGGVKQLAPVGRNGEAILDVLVERAEDAGFTGAVVVTAPRIEAQMREHLEVHRPKLPVQITLQPTPAGTADAVLAAGDAIDGSFAVVNADDLYPPDAFAMLAGHLSRSDEPALVAFPVLQTLINKQAVKRGLLDLDDNGDLVAIRESTVTAGSEELRGCEWVSMNMWGFAPSILETLACAVDEFTMRGTSGEILLPDVVSSLVAQGVTVHVLRCDQPCIGITYAEDVDVVRAALS